MKVTETMIKKRKVKDRVLQTVTLISSSISVMILIMLFFFIFQKGAGSLSFKLLTDDYWAKNYLLDIPSVQTGTYVKPANLPSASFWSVKYGFAVTDALSHEKQKLILIEYIDPASPLAKMTDASSGPNFGKAQLISVGMQIHKIGYVDINGDTRSAGTIADQNAKTLVDTLDSSALTLNQAYIKTTGGGIRGSIVSTFYLILISLLLAVPIGIMTAIYLNEYAKYNRFTPWLRSSIEMLTGVPSITYGLMGMVVLYPVTALFKASGTSILLGGLTLSVILLPTVIRSTEEALKVVPDNFRDASLSLGANQAQTIFRIVLPSAIPGILSAILLSLGRIIGESAALIYTMGTFVNDSPTVLTGGTSLAVHIWSLMSGEQPNFALASAISIIILIIVLILNISVKLLSGRLRKTWQ